ncbi:MAG: quinolinate synthase NadA [Phycisphaerales bacterium]|nr:quinolinate synthase NadA [Phycisphaerales bacterium]
MPIVAKNLQRAVELYLACAYPDGVPASVQGKAGPVMALEAEALAPVELFERSEGGGEGSYVLRLGQPMYPFMKLVIDPVPEQGTVSPTSYLLRADAHDRHLHAPAGSPDAAWLASVRVSNRDLVEKIEAAWAKAGLPTFKEYLRAKLAARRAKKEGGGDKVARGQGGRGTGERIAARKAELGERLVILGHHYQCDEVVGFVDVLGDSFQLAREAAKLTRAEYVVFCGVYFMAESADVLTGDHQKVILPDLDAGCSMADMAKIDDVQRAWGVINEACADIDGFKLVPITYINSSAAIKAFVGEHGGTVCTSSNCEKILAWAMDQKPKAQGLQSLGLSRKVLFFPDQHLGRNTAYKMSWPLESMVVWDYTQPRGGLSDEEIRKATFILWKGCCSVHQVFRAEHVDQARAKWPGVRVIVHPECCFEVVQKADLSGSTDLIGKTIAASPAGSKWAVGTEINMVRRLAKLHPDKQIELLGECECLCPTMARVDPARLLWVLDNLAERQVVNQVVVGEDVKRWARVSLQRMLDITK